MNTVSTGYQRGHAMSQDTVTQTVLGNRTDTLSESVSLATPLTLGRITGRAEAARTMQQIASAFGLETPEFIADGGDHTVVTFAGHAGGKDVGLLAVLTPGEGETYDAIDLYARPWPFVAMAREKLAAEHELFRADVDLSNPYVATGPTAGYLDAPPPVPGLAEDVAFHSPVLTWTAAGRDLVATVLKAVEATYGTPRFRAAFPVGNSVVALYDGSVHGHVIQIGAIFTLNAAAEIADMRIYSRPWPVTALFRGEVYKLLRPVLGPEFWQGPPPLAALGEDDS